MALLAEPLKKLIFGRAFKAEAGRVTILKALSVSFYESSALAMTVQEVYNLTNEKKSLAFWNKIGQQVIHEGTKSFGVNNPKGHINIFRANLNFTDFFGWGKFTLRKAEWNIKKFHIIFEVTNSPILEYGIRLYGSKSKAHLFIIGIFSGLIEAFIGRKMVPKSLSPYTYNTRKLVFEVR